MAALAERTARIAVLMIAEPNTADTGYVPAQVGGV